MAMNWKRRNDVISEPISDYLRRIINEEKAKGYDLHVSIGTDSARIGRSYKFGTIIMITTEEDLGGGIKAGRGGLVIHSTYFLAKHENARLKLGKEGVNERMMIEVGKSIEAAYEIYEVLDEFGIKLEIHADINPDPRHDSNKALQEAIGWILGMGYDFKIKPEALAASYGADKVI